MSTISSSGNFELAAACLVLHATVAFVAYYTTYLIYSQIAPELLARILQRQGNTGLLFVFPRAVPGRARKAVVFTMVIYEVMVGLCMTWYAQRGWTSTLYLYGRSCSLAAWFAMVPYAVVLAIGCGFMTWG